MRPANLVTAVADVASGFAIGFALADGVDIWQGLGSYGTDLLFLSLATIGLYGGGVVFNDVFDLEIDSVERPERPLPSGEVSKKHAITMGVGLFLSGIAAALLVGFYSGLLALVIAILALVYDMKGKHYAVMGPLNMSLCRGANLLLGMSAWTGSLSLGYSLIILPILYISSITLISRGEVAGGNKAHLSLALIGYALVAGLLLGLGIFFSYQAMFAVPFVVLFLVLVYPPLLKAWKSLDATDIRKAVKAGVVTLILLDAALAAGFTSIGYGLLVAVLLPISLWLGNFFSVT